MPNFILICMERNANWRHNHTGEGRRRRRELRGSKKKLPASYPTESQMRYKRAFTFLLTISPCQYAGAIIIWILSFGRTLLLLFLLLTEGVQGLFEHLTSPPGGGGLPLFPLTGFIGLYNSLGSQCIGGLQCWNLRVVTECPNQQLYC